MVPSTCPYLIDLIHGGIIKVINSQDMLRTEICSNEDVRYCTLSYRWGETSHSCVLTKPFDTTLEFTLDSIPETFQDAVKVTRELGIRYLWIDALCILQPTLEDRTEWLDEGSRMGIIYQNAVCPIAATTSLYADEGFLKKTGRSIFPGEPVVIFGIVPLKQYYIPVSVPRLYDCIHCSPLNARGWVTRESSLD